MTITVKDVIKAELLKVCKEATENHRAKQDKKEKKEKFSDAKIEKIRNLYARIGWTGATLELLMERDAIMFDAPELKGKQLIPVDILTVVVPEKNVKGHKYTVNNPYIVTLKDGTNAFMALHADGRTDSSWMFALDEPRHATDEEIEQCIENLSAAQWDAIYSNAIFRNIRDAALLKEFNVPDEPAKEGNGHFQDGDEVKMPDGRTITV